MGFARHRRGVKSQAIQTVRPGSPSITRCSSLGRLPGVQGPRSVGDPVAERSAVGFAVMLHRPRNADELRFHMIRRCSHDRISVSPHVDELDMGSVVGIAKGAGALDVSRLRIFEGRSDSMFEREVDRRLVNSIASLDGINCA